MDPFQLVLDAERALVAGDLDAAERSAHAALLARPEPGLALNVLGIIAAKRGDAPLAVLLWETATRAAPAMPQPWVSLGEAFFHIGQFDKAVHCFREALTRKNDLYSVRVNLGVALQQLGRHEDAVNELRLALSHLPEHTEGAVALATSLHHLGRTHQAVDVLIAASKRDPRNAKVLSNLGVLHEKLGDLESSIAFYDRALALNPDDPQTLFNRGSSLIQLLKVPQARRDWERALALDPANDTTATNLAIAELLDGELVTGFARFERRWGVRHQKFPIAAPEWKGEDLNGKRLILFVEQGLGDMLQFGRFVPLLKKRYPRSHLTVSTLPTLHPLLKSLTGLDAAIDVHPPYPPADYTLSLLSVPHVLGTTLDTIPAEAPYLAPDPERTAKWRSRLHSLTAGGRGGSTGKAGRKIGLFWQGTKVDENRTIRLAELAPLWQAAPDATFISLQKGMGEEEIAAFPHPLTPVGHELLDYSDTAAVLAELDLVITIDTSLAHAAGALARPTWTLLPFRPDWRWLLHRPDCPWYPTMRLYRQHARKDWSQAVAALASDLKARTQR